MWNCIVEMGVKHATQVKRETLLSRERLRKRHRPKRVSVLFVGEAPPASGRFFYQADSGLYRAIGEAFVEAFPVLHERHFLTSFRRMGCYLVDLCGGPVDHLNGGRRKKARREGETRLSVVLKQLCPEVVVTVAKSIAANVERSQARAGWSGLHMNLPYPGRWHHHRIAFIQALVPILRKNFNRNLSRIAVDLREDLSSRRANGKVTLTCAAQKSRPSSKSDRSKR
jgi:hypothetical protein